MLLPRPLSNAIELSLSGRFITNDSITPLFERHKKDFRIKSIGTSVLGKEIFSFLGGNGPKKILMWSQMHGNESTTTKSVFDLLNYLSAEGNDLLKEVTINIIPILNPDGAALYTRENANKIDLNRDFVDLSQPESKLLNEVFHEFKPDYCFNLHDQRTIYGAGDSGKPATVSFLSPSFNEARDVNASRSQAKEIISVMNDALQEIIPGQVGRYDDSYNPNCVGDTFQARGISTILFEAGHFKNDYLREKTRQCIFLALVVGIKYIARELINGCRNEDYLNIPQNRIVFYDFVYRNVKINYGNKEIITNFASQYKEELIDNKILFTAFISDIGELNGCFGHIEYDSALQLYQDGFSNTPQLEQKADFRIGERQFINGAPID